MGKKLCHCGLKCKGLWEDTVGNVEFTVGRHCGGCRVYCGKTLWGMLSALWDDTVGDVKSTVG